MVIKLKRTYDDKVETTNISGTRTFVTYSVQRTQTQSFIGSTKATRETHHGIYGDDYVGATIIVEAFGEIQIDGVHILEHSKPIPVSEYDQLHPFVGKIDQETGEWEGTGIAMLY